MNLTSNSTEQDVLDFLTTKLDHDIESKFHFLRDQYEQFENASKNVDEAKNRVSFLDKINIFTKSDTEHVRDNQKEIVSQIDQKIKAAKKVVKQIIKDAIPTSLETGCLFGDIKSSINLSQLSIDKSINKCDEIGQEIQDINTNALNKAQNKELVTNQHRNNNSETDHLNELKQQLGATSNVLKDASDKLMTLVNHLEKTNNTKIMVITKDEMVQRVYNSLSVKYNS